jgi:hypothetical protein
MYTENPDHPLSTNYMLEDKLKMAQIGKKKKDRSNKCKEINNSRFVCPPLHPLQALIMFNF